MFSNGSPARSPTRPCLGVARRRTTDLATIQIQTNGTPPIRAPATPWNASVAPRPPTPRVTAAATWVVEGWRLGVQRAN
jgi:hypothetical protein